MKTVHDMNMNGKRVLIRADLNVPLDQGVVVNPARILSCIPTIRLVLEKGGRPILISHLETADGSAASLAPVAKSLSELAGIPVRFLPECIGPAAEAASREVPPGGALLLENLRVHAGEKKNAPEFAAALAKLGDVFVQDAFGTAHRAHASMVALPALFTEKAPGLLMQRELDYYERSLVKPRAPLVVVIGGSKLSTKVDLLANLASKADKMVIGGAMANTFLGAQGIQMGRSLLEKDYFPKALGILAEMSRRDRRIYLPVDVLVAPRPDAETEPHAVPVLEIHTDEMALDIGPATRVLYREVLANAGTVVWNGPMGFYEREAFAQGTIEVAQAIVQAPGLKIAGGGDTDTAIQAAGVADKFDFISTGGGAFLALMEGKPLPGIKALSA